MTDMIAPTEEFIARAKALYDGGGANNEVRALLGMSKYRFLAFRKAQGWALRPQIAVSNGRPRGGGDFDATLDRLIATLEKAVLRELAYFEKELRSPPEDFGVTARTLSNLAKALAGMDRLQRDGDAKAPARQDDQGSPRDMAELRAELARRLERMAAEDAMADRE